MTFFFDKHVMTESKKEKGNYRYPISEIFGPVASGEGLAMGTPTIFIRFGGCTYRCSWCDSLYAVLPEYRGDWVLTNANDIVDILNSMNTAVRHITFSGGNPAIQPLDSLIDRLGAAGYTQTAIETQGDVYPDWIDRVGTLTVSPKPPSSGNTTDPRLPTLQRLVERINAKGAPSSLKIVVFCDEDYDYAKTIHQTYPDTQLTLQVGTDQTTEHGLQEKLLTALSALQEKALNDPVMHDVRVLPQLHALLYGLRRGI